MNVGGCLSRVLVFLVVFAIMVAFPPLGLALMFLGFAMHFYRKG
jgi:hypothetical protein